MNLAFLDLYSITKYQEGDVSQPNQHPVFTTLKSKQQGWAKKTTDYIFMAKNQYLKNKGIIIQEYLEPADLTRYGLLNTQTGYPSPDHPSDHFSLAY